MAHVDMDRITRDRNDKLQTILNSNIESRKDECNQASQTFARQNEQVEQLSAHLTQVSEQLH